MESVLGATPREFESRILRHADLQKHRSWQLSHLCPALAWSHLVVSVMSCRWCHRQDQPQLLCLVTGVVNGHERRGARRQSVRPAVQGRAGPSATWVHIAVGCGRIPANSQTASHSVIEKFEENARRAACSAHRRAADQTRLAPSSLICASPTRTVGKDLPPVWVPPHGAPPRLGVTIGRMGFWRRADRRAGAARPHHPWQPPEAEFPGLVPVNTLLLGRTEQAAVAITGLSAYSAGFVIFVTARFRPRADGGSRERRPDAPGDLAATRRSFRLGLQFADGTRVIGQRGGPRTRSQPRAPTPDPAAVPGRRPALAFLAVVGMTTAASRAAGVCLRVARVRDHQSAARHRRAANPERRQPEHPAMARRPGLMTGSLPAPPGRAADGWRAWFDMKLTRGSCRCLRTTVEGWVHTRVRGCSGFLRNPGRHM